MSTGDPRNRPRVVRQAALFGGTDVLSLYGRNGRIRTNTVHCPSDAAATRVVQQTRQLERAELAEERRTRVPPRHSRRDIPSWREVQRRLSSRTDWREAR
jgi:hypothetical protein